MVDKNIDALLHWDFAHLQSLEFEYAYGRQGNLYAGDTQNTNTNALVQNNYGKETNRIYRETFGLTHRGAWDNGVSTNNYVQFERTRNTRIKRRAGRRHRRYLRCQQYWVRHYQAGRLPGAQRSQRAV